MENLEVLHSKIIPQEKLQSVLTYWRFKEYRVVFTNGCFDLLHKGHIEYMARAADQGDILVLGLNSDKSVKRIKGDSRPVQDESSRSLVLAALKFVTAVVLFDEETPYELIKLVQPDVLVKGADYNEEDIVGADIVKARGGEIRTITLTEGYSTTDIIRKIKQNN